MVAKYQRKNTNITKQCKEKRKNQAVFLIQPDFFTAVIYL